MPNFMSRADRYGLMNMIKITDISKLKWTCLKIPNCNIKGMNCFLNRGQKNDGDNTWLNRACYLKQLWFCLVLVVPHLNIGGMTALTEVFCGFLSSSKQILEKRLNLDHKIILPHPFQSIIHYHPVTQCHYSSNYWQCP